MKKIELSQGKFALVDDVDFKWLNQFKWTYDSLGYARRNDKGKKVYMHRLINNTPDGFITDHINRDGLDNRRENLRTTTKTQNLFNTGLFKHNKSGHKGVSWSKSAKKWLARIQVNKKVIHLGLYSSIRKAVLARENYTWTP